MRRPKTIKQAKQLRAVLYVRISVDRENQSSIENQLRELREFCKLHNIIIVDEFSDVGISAFDLEVERPGFDQAMAMIESGEANHLLVWKLDRMTRNARGFTRIHDRLESVGATFGSLMEPWFDTSSPMGLALVFLMATMAEIEAENIQKRILSWHEGRRRNGSVPIGPRPYGYDRPEPNMLIINPKEEAIIIECAERILGGDQLRAIARDLTARGIPTPSASANPNRKQIATEWNHTSIRKMLLSPTVAGKYADGRQGESWKPILSGELATMVVDTLRDPVRASQFGAQRIPNHLLTNIARCHCGSEMNTFVNSKARRYRCKGCKMTINADVIESVISEWVTENVTDGKWRAMRAAGKGRDETVIENLNREIEELFIDFHSRKGKPGAIPDAVYNRLMDDKTAELNSALSSPAMKLPDVASVVSEWGSMSIADRRLVINGAIQSITVAPLPQGAKPCAANARKRVAIVGKFQ